MKAYVRLDDQAEIAAISTFPDHAEAGTGRLFTFYRPIGWKSGSDGKPLPNDSSPNTIRDAPIGEFPLKLSDVVTFAGDDRAYAVGEIGGRALNRRSVLRNASGSPYVTHARIQ